MTPALILLAVIIAAVPTLTVIYLTLAILGSFLGPPSAT